jgi:hypothetical protein
MHVLLLLLLLQVKAIEAAQAARQAEEAKQQERLARQQQAKEQQQAKPKSAAPKPQGVLAHLVACCNICSAATTPCLCTANSMCIAFTSLAVYSRLWLS